ncbi:hypothetical protein [Streptomyces althioticus]|uniref:hypothetical protein n=1 Tax=Streptomyces althioticus TaxID=83380 RepID=UPI00369057D3
MQDSTTDTRPFSIADIAAATARRLGDDWAVARSNWGTAGYLRGPYATRFTIGTDERSIEEGGDLTIRYEPQLADLDGFPADPALPDDVFKDGHGVRFMFASPSDGLDAVADLVADTIRAITGADEEGDAPHPPAVSQVAAGVRKQIEELLDRWGRAADPDEGSNDEEHEVGIDMAELLWQLHGSLPPRD